MFFSQQSQNHNKYNAKAVYYPAPGGGLRLARVQVFSQPRFSEGQSFALTDDKPSKRARGSAPSEENTARAARRARRNAFDLIMCNHDLDAFVTLTYSPDEVADKSAYDECYERLRAWLSNGVQRRGLKYVCVPEYTKKGDIHFHALANQAALRLEAARSAKTGRLLKHHGEAVYNVTDWRGGFSTAQIVRQRAAGEDARLAVAKYIFKYMGKNMDAKIGGRYMLSGGELARPVEICGDGWEQFSTTPPKSEYSMEIDGAGKYWEYSFL